MNDATKKLSEKGEHKMSEIAGVIGLMVDYVKGVEYGKGSYRHLEQEKIRALAWNKGDFEGTWRLGKKAREDQKWWFSNIDTEDRRICIETPELTLTTDASGTEWGAVFGKEKTNGRYQHPGDEGGAVWAKIFLQRF